MTEAPHNWYRWQADTLILLVRIQPKASRDAFDGIWQDASSASSGSETARLKLRLTAPPIDGKANKHLLAWLAKAFKVPKSSLEILAGHTGRNKRIAIPRPLRLPPELSIKPPS